jgi:hypothetical protein
MGVVFWKQIKDIWQGKNRWLLEIDLYGDSGRLN